MLTWPLSVLGGQSLDRRLIFWRAGVPDRRMRLLAPSRWSGPFDFAQDRTPALTGRWGRCQSPWAVSPLTAVLFSGGRRYTAEQELAGGSVVRLVPFRPRPGARFGALRGSGWKRRDHYSTSFRRRPSSSPNRIAMPWLIETAQAQAPRAPGRCRVLGRRATSVPVKSPPSAAGTTGLTEICRAASASSAARRSPTLRAEKSGRLLDAKPEKPGNMDALTGTLRTT